MRRSLVLTDEAARHPYRASLPPHVRRGDAEGARQDWWRLTLSDVRGFASAYVSCVVGITAFIA